jgi:hypothetical protein
LKEKDRERDHMEGTYRDKIIALDKELVEPKCLKNEAESIICSLKKKLTEKDTKRYKMKATYRDKITGFKRKLKEREGEREQTIRTLLGQVHEMGAILREKNCQTEELERKVLNMHDWKNVEKALHDQIKELKEKVPLMERHREEVMDTEQQTDGIYQEEFIPNTQIVELSKKLQEQLNIH